MPAGLTLTSAGVLAGTPTTAGASTFTIRGIDANGCAQTIVLALVIAAAPIPPPVCPAITISPTILPNGTMGVPYSQTIAGGGGTFTLHVWYYVWCAAARNDTDRRRVAFWHADQRRHLDVHDPRHGRGRMCSDHLVQHHRVACRTDPCRVGANRARNALDADRCHGDSSADQPVLVKPVLDLVLMRQAADGVAPPRPAIHAHGERRANSHSANSLNAKWKKYPCSGLNRQALSGPAS